MVKPVLILLALGLSMTACQKYNKATGKIDIFKSKSSTNERASFKISGLNQNPMAKATCLLSEDGDIFRNKKSEDKSDEKQKVRKVLNISHFMQNLSKDKNINDFTITASTESIGYAMNTKTGTSTSVMPFQFLNNEKIRSFFIFESALVSDILDEIENKNKCLDTNKSKDKTEEKCTPEESAYPFTNRLFQLSNTKSLDNSVRQCTNSLYLDPTDNNRQEEIVNTEEDNEENKDPEKVEVKIDANVANISYDLLYSQNLLNKTEINDSTFNTAIYKSGFFPSHEQFRAQHILSRKLLLANKLIFKVVTNVENTKLIFKILAYYEKDNALFRVGCNDLKLTEDVLVKYRVELAKIPSSNLVFNKNFAINLSKALSSDKKDEKFKIPAEFSDKVTDAIASYEKNKLNPQDKIEISDRNYEIFFRHFEDNLLKANSCK